MVGAHDWTGQLVGAGVVAPVALGGLSNAFSAATKSGFTVNGKLYGMPIYSENIALIWNKRDAKDPAGKSFMDLVNSTNGLAITRDLTSGDPYHWSSVASSFGLTLFTRDKSGWTTKLGYGEAGADAYANFLAGDAKKIIRPADGWDQSACTLQKGAYIISGPWMYNHGQDTISGCSAKPLKASEMGIANIPSLGGKTVSQFSGVYGYWMSSKVAGQPNAVSVGKVLRYVGSAEFQLALNKAGNNIPVNASALSAMTDKNLAAFGLAGRNANPMPAYVFMDTVWSKIGSAEAAIMAGKYTGTPGDFLRKAVAAAQAAIDTK
jgi:maltose-binding protein MalE